MKRRQKKLESWEDPTSLQVLAQALFDTDVNVRQAASQSLSEVKKCGIGSDTGTVFKTYEYFLLLVQFCVL